MGLAVVSRVEFIDGVRDQGRPRADTLQHEIYCEFNNNNYSSLN